MTGKLWQPPRLFQQAHAGHAERKVTWLELFFDLVYVATFIQLGDLLSENVSLLGFGQFALLFVPIWWSWTGITFFSNRFLADDWVHRVLIFTQILAIGAVGVSVKGAFTGLAVQFTVAYVAVRLIMVVLYYRAALRIPEAREFCLRYANGFLIAALIWLAAAFVPPPYTPLVWVADMLADFAVALSAKSRRLNAALPIDVHHTAERYGIFIIIVLGETFVKVLSSTSGAELTASVGVFALFAMIIVSCLWWRYFDDIAGALVKATGRATYIWIYSHLPLALGLVAYGVGVKKLLLEIDHPVLPDKYRWLICGALLLYLLFIAVMESDTVREGDDFSATLRAVLGYGSAVLVLVVALLGSGWNSTLLIAVLAAVFALQIVVHIVLDRSQAAGDGSHAQLP